MIKNRFSDWVFVPFLALVCLLPTALPAQQVPDCNYTKLMKEGRSRLVGTKPAYAQALNKFNAARTCDPSKSTEVDREIVRVFKMIEGERDRAVQSERKAKESAEQLQAALKVVESERNRAQQAEQTARDNLEKFQTALADVVRGALREADARILNLDYQQAYEQVKNTPRYKPLDDSVARRLLEIAYFRQNSGDSIGAKHAFDRAAIHLEQPGFNPAADFDAELARLDAGLLAFLRQRYFPLIQPLPGGLFWMGRDTMLETEGKPIELPRHQVQIAPFGLARSETTFWQWNLYVAAKKRNIQRYSPEWGLYGDNPAVNLDWVDACEYANWLSDREAKKPCYRIDSTGSPADWQIILLPDGNGYRLPTEAEWEFAARGGPDMPYRRFAGSDHIDSVAWYSGNNLIRGVPRSHAAMEKIPIVFADGTAVYDLTGSVWEWCWDAFQDNYYQQFADARAVNPTGPAIWNPERVMRGGSWYHQSKHCSVAYRWKYSAIKWSGVIGCRMAHRL